MIDDLNFLRTIKYGFEDKNFKANFNIYRPKQIHSNKIAHLDLKNLNQFNMDSPVWEGDGVYTFLKNICIGVVTADCVPLLMIDVNKNMAMAVHAGWRGIASGIVNNAVRIFLDYGFKSYEIMTFVGPCICGRCYEVQEDVIDAFDLERLNINKKQFYESVKYKTNNKYLLDFPYLIKSVLLTFDINKCFINPTCTFENINFNSYRREGKGGGKNYSWICL